MSGPTLRDGFEPTSVEVHAAHLDAVGGDKKPYVLTRFVVEAAPGAAAITLDVALVAPVARELGHRLMHFANASDHRGAVSQLRDVYASLEVAQRLWDAGEYMNLGAILARIRERAEPPAFSPNTKGDLDE
jgi:hypothetical protein